MRLRGRKRAFLQEKENDMTARTKKNLNTAMLNEALAYAKYTRFAACARMNDDPELARLFQNTADVDRIDHFRKEFDLAVLCNDDVANLRAAVEDKAHQIDMYTEFAEQARSDGESAAAELFDRIRKHELTELAAFEAALQNAGCGAECSEAVAV
jgi:rubrerythrin